MKNKRFHNIAYFLTPVFLVSLYIVYALYSQIRIDNNSNGIEFVENILSKGGTVYYIPHGQSEVELELNHVSRKTIDAISIIQVKNANISVNDFKNILPLKKIKSLGFNNCNIHHLSLKDILPESGHMESIGFHNCVIDGEARLYLPTSVMFDTIGFENTKVEDSFFQYCSGMVVDSIVIINTPISEKGLEHLLPLAHLRHLNLDTTNISDSITFFFDKCPNLKQLFIWRTSIRCEFIRDTINTNSLESLELYKTKFDDEIAPSLSRFSSLRDISIIDCPLTKQSVKCFNNLSDQLKNANIYNHNDEVIFEKTNVTID